MPSSHSFGVIFALVSALLFGAGDFSGGFASRRSNQFQVLALSAVASVTILAVFVLLWGEPLPTPRSSLWAVLAGIAGALGLAALYRGLSLGDAALVAPTAGVIGAALPVVFSAFTEGLPNETQLAGFITAGLGIWFVTRSPSTSGAEYRQGLVLAALAGVAFGGFFILIAQVDSGALFAPLLVAKVAAVCVALLLLRFSGIPLPSPKSSLVALLAGILDAAANASYLFARQFTRLDVAAVLASLYPAATVFLAYMLLKEKISHVQWIGVTLCLLAITLIIL